MLLDHIGIILFPNVIAFRYIGRISFPIFCFLITEGYKHTSNLHKYALRLFLFALISEVPFNMMINNSFFSLKSCNVYVTLFLSVILIYLIDTFHKHKIDSLFLIPIIFALTLYVNSDYSIYGLILILFFFKVKKYNVIFIIVFLIISYLYGGPIQLTSVFSLLILKKYNGEKGTTINKYYFYCFYPIHILILLLIKTAI